MKVMGFTRLVLVSPAAALDGEAVAVAHGAHDVLAAARVVETLDEALRDVTLVVGTTARTGKDRMTPIKLRRFVTEVLATYAPATLAIVFGSEASGLANDDLERCQFAVEIPTGPLFHSLNLAQAVMVVCYELFTSSTTAVEGASSDAPARAPAAFAPPRDDVRRQRMESLYRGLEQFLSDVGYPNRSSIVRAMADARRVLDAAWLTERDVNTVLGLFRHIRHLLRTSAAPPPPAS